MSRRIRRLLVGGLVLGVVGAVVVFAGLRLSAAARDLRAADELVATAAEQLADGRLADAQASLTRAETRVLSANESLRGSIAIDAVSWLPIVSTNLDSLNDSTQIAATLVHGGLRILDDSVPLQSDQGTLEVSLSDGTIPLDAVAEVEAEIASLSAQLLPLLHDSTPRFLLPPVRAAREKVYEEALARGDQLAVLGRGLDLLQELAGAAGPRRYLIAVANTAEMRGSGGMILNYGILEGRDGVIDLTEFGRVDELPLLRPVDAALVPPDYFARWSGFDPLERWRQANLAGDFTVVAPVLEAMYASATSIEVDGVIQVDPDGLAAVLDGVGPVVLPEVGEVSGDNVVQLTLHEAYVRFPGVEDRSDVLGDVAEASFRRLVDGDIPSLRTLATRLVDAVDGRHILMHATTKRMQSQLAAFGADGSLPPLDGVDSWSLTVQNLTGNKLDYFVDTALGLEGERPAGQFGDIAATVTVSNTATPGLFEPRYIYGPGFVDGAPPAGVERALVTLYLPTGTSLEGASGDPTLEPVSSGSEGGRAYASYIVDVPAGESRSVTLDLRLAPRSDAAYEMLVIPTPRVRPTQLTVGIVTGEGRVEGGVLLDRTWVLSLHEPAQVLAPTFR